MKTLDLTQVKKNPEKFRAVKAMFNGNYTCFVAQSEYLDEKLEKQFQRKLKEFTNAGGHYTGSRAFWFNTDTKKWEMQ